MGPIILSRRTALKAAAGATAALVVAPPAWAADTTPKPLDPFRTILDAFDTHTLVAIGEHHQLQESHDWLTALLYHPDFPTRANDIVVEFGNALYQDVADRFVVAGEPVGNAELEQIWRNTIGGGVVWDAPVYGQFFRTVRGINCRLPAQQRVRVLLGDPAVNLAAIKGIDDAAAMPTEASHNTYYADVVEREVLAKGRKALLVAGFPHLRRGLHPTEAADQPNAATLLVAQHPGELFVVDVLPFNPGWAADDVIERVATDFHGWPRPSLALLAGTWLGSTPMPRRALDPASTYGQQGDAVLWLGPDAALTASRADPAIYQCGDYAAELQRRGDVLSQIEGNPVDFIADGLAAAHAGAGWPGR